MSWRMAMVSLAVALVGCRAGTSVHGTVDVAQWTPVLEAEAFSGSGDTLDLVDQGGVREDDALWTFDVSMQFSRAQERRVSAGTLNLGYWSHDYSGTGDAGSVGVQFGGAPVPLRDEVKTDFDVNLFKFTYGEPQAASGGGNNRTEGMIGLHYLDYSVEARDEHGTPARYAGNAPMFVIGWKIAYADRAMVYFFSVEGMDLDVITLDNVQGDVLDYSAGVRWNIGTSAALSVAYREYQAHLQDRSEKLNVKVAGAFFSLFIMW